MSVYILGLDPGADQGWALLRDGELISCGLGEPLASGCLCIVERPTIYKYGKAKPEDIITLAIRAGMAAGRAQSRGCTVEWVEPRTWKGTISKDMHHRRIRAKLQHMETLVLGQVEKALPEGKFHNVMDAVALAKWRWVQPM